MQAPDTSDAAAEAVVTQYVFVVARYRPDIFARAMERFGNDPNLQVVLDRRFGERRRASLPHTPERRRAERRRAVKFWEDLTLSPMMVARKHRQSYEELQHQLTALSAEIQALRTDNTRLRTEVATLQARLDALATADAALKADAGAALGEFERTLDALSKRLHGFARQSQRPEDKPRLRSA